jgi:CRISPR/Cas system-associated exonuclease Cas4 (RecB family)
MYQELIDDILTARHVAEQKERGSDEGEWHPSSLTGCDRAATYSYIGEPKSDETTPRSMAVLQRGTDLHAILQNELVERHGKGFLPEVKVDYRGVKGSCDGLLVVADGILEAAMASDHEPMAELEPVYEVQEFKSIKSLHFVKSHPKPEHMMQARIYAWGLRHMGYMLDLIRIVYIERETLKVIEYFVQPWTDDEERKFEDTLDNLDAHVDEGTLPDQMPDDYWLCRYCDWRTTCKGVQ